MPAAFYYYNHLHEELPREAPAVPHHHREEEEERRDEDEDATTSDGGGDAKGKKARPAGRLFDRLRSEVVANLTQPDSTSTAPGVGSSGSSGANGASKVAPTTAAQAQYNAALRALAENDDDDRLVNIY